jgi:predicted nuclease with TOPRIM domain
MSFNGNSSTNNTTSGSRRSSIGFSANQFGSQEAASSSHQQPPASLEMSMQSEGTSPWTAGVQPAVVGIHNHEYFSLASQLPNDTEPDWLRYFEANKEHIDALWASFYDVNEKVDDDEWLHRLELHGLGEEVTSLRNKTESIEAARQVGMAAVSRSLRGLRREVEKIRDFRTDLEECRQRLEVTDEATTASVEQISERISAVEKGVNYYGWRIREQDNFGLDLNEKVDNRLKPLEQNVEKILKAMDRATFDEAPREIEDKSTAKHVEDMKAAPAISPPTVDTEARSTVFAGATMDNLLAIVQKLQDDSAADREKSQARMLALEEQVKVLTVQNSGYREREERMQCEIGKLKTRVECAPTSSWNLPTPESLKDEEIMGD